MLRFRNRRGQPVLEYVLVLTAIIAVIIWAAGRFLKPGVEKTMDNTTEAVGKVADKIDDIQ